MSALEAAEQLPIATADGNVVEPLALPNNLSAAIVARPIVPVEVIVPPVMPLLVAMLVTVPVPPIVVQVGSTVTPPQTKA